MQKFGLMLAGFAIGIVVYGIGSLYAEQIREYKENKIRKIAYERVEIFYNEAIKGRFDSINRSIMASASFNEKMEFKVDRYTEYTNKLECDLVHLNSRINKIEQRINGTKVSEDAPIQ